jgi:hypothetical protein
MDQSPSTTPASERADKQCTSTELCQAGDAEYGSQAGDFFVSFCFDGGWTFGRTRRFGFSRSLFQLLEHRALETSSIHTLTRLCGLSTAPFCPIARSTRCNLPQIPVICQLKAKSRLACSM